MIDESRELSAKPPKTSIHRVDPETGDRKFVARVSTDLATEEFVARRYGPGKYALTHQIVGDNGSYKYHSSDTFLIDETAEPAAAVDDPPLPPAAGAPAVVAPIGGNILDRALEAGVLRLLEQSNRQFDLQTAMIERITKAEPRASGPTTLEIIAALTPLLAPVLAEIFKSRGDPTKNAIELAAILSKRDGGNSTLEALERGINIAHKLGAGDHAPSDGGMLPVVGEGIRVLGGIVDSIVTERRAARGDVPAGDPVATVDGKPPLALVPNEPTMAPADAGASSSSSSDRLWISVARPQMPALLAAARFIPPGAAAETIAANLSPAALADLLEDVNDQTAPGFAARLAGVFPQLANINAAWFAEMLKTLLEITSEEPLEETAPAAARGKGGK